MVRLVGRKCTVKFLLNELRLSDTGAEVLIILHCWIKQSLLHCDVPEIAALLGMNGLDLKAANANDLPYKGWVELTFMSD